MGILFLLFYYLKMLFVIFNINFKYKFNYKFLNSIKILLTYLFPFIDYYSTRRQLYDEDSVSPRTKQSM